MIKKRFERKTYTYGDIDIHVEIDYDNQKISLVESNGSLKRWVFAGRTLDYMKGWQNILAAMSFAVGKATEELSAHLDEHAELGDSLYGELAKRIIGVALNEAPRKTKKKRNGN